MCMSAHAGGCLAVFVTHFTAYKFRGYAVCYEGEAGNAIDNVGTWRHTVALVALQMHGFIGNQTLHISTSLNYAVSYFAAVSSRATQDEASARRASEAFGWETYQTS
eukprot:s773_g2.t1